MNRLNRILSAALVIQIVMAAIVFVPRLFPASAESAPLFGPIEAGDVAGLTVWDDEGNRVDLSRKDGVWVVPDAGDFPADAAKIDGFLGKLSGLTTNPLVTRTSASHKRLKVADDDFLRRVDFTLADGSSRTLFIGTDSTGGTAHVRASGQDEVYLSRDLSRFDANAAISSWIDPVYLNVPQDKMISLTVENGSGTLEFEKDAAGTWTMKGLAAGEVFKPDNLNTMLSRLSSLRMMRPIGTQEEPAYGFDVPNAVITLTATDDAGQVKTYSLRVGAKYVDEDNYVVSSSESPYYVRIAAFSIEDFVTRTREDFLQPPPTPTMTPEATLTPEATSQATPTPEATQEATPRPTP